MDHKLQRKLRHSLLLAFKIGLGSSLAIFIARLLHLDNSVAAGSITLLTLMTSKWGTVRLSLYRLATFFVCVALSFVVYNFMGTAWVHYGLVVFLMVALCDLLGWTAAISVNALIGAHFLESMDFSPAFIWNEFQLILIGVVMAFLLSMVYTYREEEKHLVRQMRQVEEELQTILRELADHLAREEKPEENVWKDIEALKLQLFQYISEAQTYQENTYQSHPSYYIDYFEMRLDQCDAIYNLQNGAGRMRYLPVQAKVISEYLRYLADYVVEVNPPTDQIDRLHEIIANMKQEALPVTREEFENRALLYHMLMDLEDFLLCKTRFVEGLDEEKLRLYWQQNS